MSRSTEEKIRITALAVQWLHRLEAEPGETTADEFSEWLHASPAHLESFLKQSEIEEALRQGQARRSLDIRPLERRTSVSRTAPRWFSAFGAAALLVIGLWTWRTAQPVEHHTEAAHSVVYFSGGSNADLYPDTQLSARSVAGFSRINVDRGGGKFHVRHRPWQRFQVKAGDVLITATGTAFNVLRIDDRVGVFVVEGNVRVDGRAQRVMLSRGQSTSVSADGVIGDVYASAPSLTPGPQYLNDVTLAAIADTINRRNLSPQIVVKGAARERRFRGYVGLDDPEAWVAALATYSDLKIERERGRVTIHGSEQARP
jgi:transmembrane sensor